ncbi:hypothetical protein MKZ38_007592 [Zalerion maritima]|uniref:Uncharacterized protein n=1 Tax=Zalerion maritima TaxID=339359 RepID=A0AAD5RWS6_9PEZI|nr:hypothetical protein MKZ38_007592 [Zalerion maritima]
MPSTSSDQTEPSSQPQDTHSHIPRPLSFSDIDSDAAELYYRVHDVQSQAADRMASAHPRSDDGWRKARRAHFEDEATTTHGGRAGRSGRSGRSGSVENFDQFDTPPALKGQANTIHTAVPGQGTSMPQAVTIPPANLTCFPAPGVGAGGVPRAVAPSLRYSPFCGPVPSPQPGPPLASFPCSTSIHNAINNSSAQPSCTYCYAHYPIGTTANAPLTAPHTPPAMSGYATQGPQGPSYQLQVPNTQNGAIVQTYVPRHDGGALFIHPGPDGVYATTAAPGPVNQIGGVSAQFVAHMPPSVYPQQPQTVAQPGYYGGPQPQVITSAAAAPRFPASYVTTPGVANASFVPGGGPVPVPSSHTPVGVNVAMASPGLGGFTTSSGLSPAVAGIGRTAGEVAIEEARFAYENNLFEPQDFKPADDDPNRFYPMRQLDGFWTNVSRATIDKLSTRWYLGPSGGFYAIRLED